MDKHIKEILNNRIIGIVGEQNSGKTTTLVNIINIVQKYDTNIVGYFFHSDYKKMLGKKINTYINNVDDLLYIENSFIFIDEPHTLFNLEDRHQKKVIENIFSMVEHNNNVVVMSGLPQIFNQLLSKQCKVWLLKKFKFKDCVNGTSLKQFATGVSGEYNGGIGLNIPVDKVLYKAEMLNVGYDKKSDKKYKRVDLFQLKKGKK